MRKTICLEVKNINFKYQGLPVLENISFKIFSGDYVGIIGPNGAGKTTLLKIILGIIKPTTGQVSIFGEKLEDFKDKYLISYIPQRISQADNFPATVEEIVISGRTARLKLGENLSNKDFQSITKAMEIAGVEHLKNKIIKKLSGGERQRVFIARALASKPKILILDEPAVGIDIASQEKFYSFLAKLNKEFRLTILFVSHDIDVVTHETKSILCLNRNLICHGLSKEIIKGNYLRKLYGDKMKYVLHGH